MKARLSFNPLPSYKLPSKIPSELVVQHKAERLECLPPPSFVLDRLMQLHTANHVLMVCDTENPQPAGHQMSVNIRRDSWQVFFFDVLDKLPGCNYIEPQ
jgi:hypothetical protein